MQTETPAEMLTRSVRYEISAAFIVGGCWTWRTFRTFDANKHAAIRNYGATIGATGFDFGNADVRELGFVWTRGGK